MKLIRKTPLRNMTQLKGYEAEVQNVFTDLLCIRAKGSPLEHHASKQQQLLGCWFKNLSVDDEISDASITASLRRALAPIWRVRTIRGALSVYGVYPDDGMGFGLAPEALGNDLLNCLKIPDNQPCAFFWHLENMRAHLHVLVSRYSQEKDCLLTEGNGWPVRELREYLKPHEKNITSSDFMGAIRKVAPRISRQDDGENSAWQSFHRVLAASGTAYTVDSKAEGESRLVIWGANIPAIHISSEMSHLMSQNFLGRYEEYRP